MTNKVVFFLMLIVQPFSHRILNIPKILNYKRISFIIIIDMGEKKGRTDQVSVIGLLRPL
jgi:hypothetical protein